MKIISRFQDYYDGAMALGHLDGLTYVRHTEAHLENGRADDIFLLAFDSLFANLPEKWSGRLAKSKHIAYQDIHLSPFMVAFCGKLYAALEVRRVDWTTRHARREQVEHLYDVFAFEELMAELHIESEGAIFRHHSPLELFRQFMLQQGDESMMAFLAGQRAPVVLLKRQYQNEVQVDPVLKDVQFYKLFDSLQAYQEIGFFLANIAVPEKPQPIEVPEKYRILYGMDMATG